jgi:hypothetical protein
MKSKNCPSIEDVIRLRCAMVENSQKVSSDFSQWNHFNPESHSAPPPLKGAAVGTEQECTEFHEAQ